MCVKYHYTELMKVEKFFVNGMISLRISLQCFNLHRICSPKNKLLDLTQ